MRSTDVAYAGVNIDALAVGGASAAVGFRIIPILAAGATQKDLKDAYASLKVRVKKQTQNFLTGTTEDAFVPGPDWIAGPGIGQITLIGGLSGTTYRVWIATDCKEMKFVDTPILEGFAGANAPAGGFATRTTKVGLALSAGAPASSADAVDFANAKSWRITVSAGAGNTITPIVGKLDAYRWDNTLGRAVRVPDLDLNIAHTVAIRDVGWPSQEIPLPVGLISYRPNGMALSAGATVDVLYEVFQ